MDAILVTHIILMLISLALGGVALFCFGRVLVAMRENGERPLANFCLAALLLVGAGSLIAFVYGIHKSREWGIAPTMMLWGTCTSLLLALLGAVLALPA